LVIGDKSFYQPTHQSPGARDNFWIPFLAALIAFLADVYLIPGVFTLPLLLLMVLIFLAFRLPAWMVAIWTAMYAGVILTILLAPVQEAKTDPALRPYARTAIFLAGGSAAIVVASHRRRLEKGQEALFNIISSLPLPVIISDISGNILLLNDAARQVLKNHLSELSGLSFFSTFVSPDNQGKTIAKYISYFDPALSRPFPTILRTRSEPPLTLHASITVFGIDKRKYAISVVERVE
jgi:PAS domain-containing protein